LLIFNIIAQAYFKDPVSPYTTIYHL